MNFLNCVSNLTPFVEPLSMLSTQGKELTQPLVNISTSLIEGSLTISGELVVLKVTGGIMDNLPGMPDIFSAVGSLFNLDIDYACLSLINDNNLLCNSSFLYNNQIKSIGHVISMVSNTPDIVNSQFAFNTNYVYYGYSYITSLAALMSALFKLILILIPIIISYLGGITGAHFFNVIGIILNAFVSLCRGNKLGMGPGGVISRTILIILSSFINGAGGQNNSSSIARHIVAWLANVAYGFSNSFYDSEYKKYIDQKYKLFIEVNQKRTINTKYLLHRLRIGIYFYVNIFLGVWSSTAFYNQYSSDNDTINVVTMLISYVVSYVSSSCWIWLGKVRMGHALVPQNGVLSWFTSNNWRMSLSRGFSEMIAFNALSWGTFTLQRFWGYTGVSYMHTFGIFLVPYILSAIMQVRIEFYFRHLYLYGIFYSLSFSSLALNTNGIIFYILENTSNASQYGITALTGIWITQFPMEYYRAIDSAMLLNPEGHNMLFRILIEGVNMLPGVSYFYSLFFSFAYHTYVILDFMPFM